MEYLGAHNVSTTDVIQYQIVYCNITTFISIQRPQWSPLPFACPVELAIRHNKTGIVPINVTLKHVRITIVTVQKQEVSHILSPCQQPQLPSMQSPCTILHCHTWYMACLNLPFFSHYLINGAIFGKRVIEYKMCVLISLHLLPETFIF